MGRAQTRATRRWIAASRDLRTSAVFTHACQFQLAAAEVRALFTSLIDGDIFAAPIALPARLLPDTASNTLRLQSGSGRATATFWDHQPLPPALDTLHKHLLEYVARAKTNPEL
ncbi:MAG: hypothetical protein HC822_21210 [Oscillochloris sp.]|nr:hypothetical protein [Oscillochloris sp.]